MQKLLAFALGNMWTWDDDPNRAKLFRHVRQLDVRGVELTLGRREELFSFRPTQPQWKWLKNLDYVSIHSPFGMVTRAKNEEDTERQLSRIEKIYNRCNAKTVVIHPGQLPPPKVLSPYDMHFSVENMTPKRKVSHAMLAGYLKKYKNMGLCLDAAHAYLYSKDETASLIRRFGKRIDQVHLSGCYKREDHVALQSCTKNFMDSIRPLSKLDVPIIIEENMRGKDVEHAKEEIKLIREHLSIDR